MVRAVRGSLTRTDFSRLIDFSQSGPFFLAKIESEKMIHDLV